MSRNQIFTSIVLLLTILRCEGLPSAALPMHADAGAASLPNEQDKCSGLVPRPAAGELGRLFARYRLPSSADSPLEDVGDHIKRGGTGCLSIDSADFDGDGKLDYAVILRAKEKARGIALAVAREANAGTWTGEILCEWDRSVRGRLYVKTLAPGQYRQTLSSRDEDVQAGEVAEFTSTSSGIEIGLLESSAVAYFFDGQKWIHLQLSD